MSRWHTRAASALLKLCPHRHRQVHPVSREMRVDQRITVCISQSRTSKEGQRNRCSRMDLVSLPPVMQSRPDISWLLMVVFEKRISASRVPWPVGNQGRTTRFFVTVTPCWLQWSREPGRCVQCSDVLLKRRCPDTSVKDVEFVGNQHRG